MSGSEIEALIKIMARLPGLVVKACAAVEGLTSKGGGALGRGYLR